MDVLARAAAQAGVPGFAGATAADCALDALPGGMSNRLFVLRRRSVAGAGAGAGAVAGAAVVCRLAFAAGLPPGSCALDQAAVLRALSAPRLALAPRALGATPTPLGALRLEEFLDGETASSAQFRQPRFARAVGHVLGRLHGAADVAEAFASAGGGDGDVTIGARLATCARLAAAADDAGAGGDAASAVAWEAEAAWVEAEEERAADAARGLLPARATLAHSDAQPGNFLVQSDGGDGSAPPLLRLVDYEYTVVARSLARGAGFDLGNAFCEYAINYSVAEAPGFLLTQGDAGEPPLAWQRALLGAWASASGVVAAVEGEDGDAAAAAGEDNGCSDGGGGSGDRLGLREESLTRQFRDERLRAAARCARAGALHSCLFWAAWARVIAARPRTAAAASAPLDGLPPTGHSVFDFGAYSRARFAQFSRLKASALESRP